MVMAQVRAESLGLRLGLGARIKCRVHASVKFKDRFRLMFGIRHHSNIYVVNLTSLTLV